MHWIDLIHEFHDLSWITEINELFYVILIYWDAPVYGFNGAAAVVWINYATFFILINEYHES